MSSCVFVVVLQSTVFQMQLSSSLCISRDLSHHRYGYETNADSSPGFEDSSESLRRARFHEWKPLHSWRAPNPSGTHLFGQLHMFCQVHIVSLDSMIHARVFVCFFVFFSLRTINAIVR